MKLLILLALLGFAKALTEKQSWENTIPHEGQDIECKNQWSEMKSQLMSVRCMPRQTLVKLRQELGYLYTPSVVAVNRCEGMCADNLSCMPLEHTMKTITIRRLHYKTGVSRCYQVQVKEHTKCKCKCNVMEDDCNAHQVYMPENCACNCKDVKAEVMCSLSMDKVWMPKTCKCVCAKEETCSSGLEWIPSMCKCKRVMDGVDE